MPCPDPRCGTTVPLVKTLWLCQKTGKLRALKMVPKPDEKRVDFEVFVPEAGGEVEAATVVVGKGVCPECGVAKADFEMVLKAA